MDKELGKVIHYFDKAMVAVVRLTDSLKTGETVKFVHGESEFSQPVDSMEVEHQKVEEAKKGDVIGLKIGGKAREGSQVYKL